MIEEIKQQWFEMHDLKKRKLDKSVWVPLRAEKSVRNDVNHGKVGYKEEFIGHGSLMIPIDKQFVTKDLTWTDVGIRHAHCFNYLHGEYSESDKLESDNFEGIHLVLNQSFDNNFDNNEWHLHQDLVLNLGLKRENDIWVCPRQDYTEVAKLERDSKGNPILLQIKNQYLKDYLCARKCGLYITSFFSRDEILNDRSAFNWDDNSISTKVGKDIWECRVLEIHEGGFPFGETLAISHASRTDVDVDDDIPDMTSFPSDNSIKSDFREKSFNGKKLYSIMAELWKYEWINPAKISSVVLGDEQEIDIYYITDEEGNKECGNDLKKGGKWLWFEPRLVASLLAKRGSYLKWYTKDTGSISCAPSYGIHFGVNELGIITVYGKDIGNLPIWQQQIWVGHNVSPEGGISKELHDSQVKAVPSSTQAPEAFIEQVINEINKAALENLNIQFFRGHFSVGTIIHSIHRFRAVDDNGLFALAKDIARIVVDDINVEALQKIAIPPKKTKWGSLKTVENLLSIKIEPEAARKVLSPLVGVYELRHGDAHLPSSEIESSFSLIEIDRNLPSVIQGYQMLHACVNNLHIILKVLVDWKK